MVIYLDNCATTPCRKDIVAAMSKYWEEEYGNPSSPHMMGKRAKYAVVEATGHVASLIGAKPDEIVFTSGATESNNMALLGCVDRGDEAPTNVILSPIDHKSVLDVGKELSRLGIAVKHLSVTSNGQICLDSLRDLLDEHTRMVSVALVNSELGTIQDIEQIANICAEHDVLLHVDAVQGVGKIPIAVKSMGIHLMSLSGHKIFGPKGIGALYVDAKIAHRIRPLTFGGGQHRLRSGTLPVPLIVGLGMACRFAQEEMQENEKRVEAIRDLFLERLAASGREYLLNNDLDVSVPHILNIQFPGVSSEALITGLRNVAIASGSACNSDSLEPSYILRNIGLTEAQANSSVRICLNAGLAEEDVQKAVDSLVQKIEDLNCVIF